jgi:hypothetical protein
MKNPVRTVKRINSIQTKSWHKCEVLKNRGDCVFNDKISLNINKE